MPIETVAQPQKKSNLRKPGSQKITGKHVQFDEKKPRANRDAAAAELSAEQKMQTPEALLEVFDKKYPKPEDAYYQKDINGRMEMLQEYLLPLLLKSGTEQNADTLRANIQKVPGEIILKSIASSVQGWETCKELLNDQELQFHAANPDAKLKRGDEFMECADRLTRDIRNNPTEKAFLDALPKPSDPALVRQNINAARAMAEELFNDIEQVDFNLLGSGSKEFEAMKKSVKAFKQFACEEYRANRNAEITPEMQKKLLEKTQNSLESVRTYLDYKQEQFDRDPARRDAAGRQKHEQPRILKSIGMFEKLSRFYLEQSMTKPGWEYKPTGENEQKKSAFEQKLHSAKAGYTTKLVSRQSRERMGEQDKLARIQPKKPEAPKGMKR